MEYAKQVMESETWHSGEQDTSQVSVSSLPEDEESGPTATVSSATTVTTDEIVASTHANVTGDSGDTKITVEQNGKSHRAICYRYITLHDLMNITPCPFNLFRNASTLTFGFVFANCYVLMTLISSFEDFFA